LFETTPSVSVRASPNGVPIAITSCPGTSPSLVPSSAYLNVMFFFFTVSMSSCTIARSVQWSSPIRCAGTRSLFASVM
jgi:hypothetical protein